MTVRLIFPAYGASGRTTNLYIELINHIQDVLHVTDELGVILRLEVALGRGGAGPALRLAALGVPSDETT